MAWLPDGEKISKISLFVLAQLANVTDARTDGHRVTAYTALMHTHRAIKIMAKCFGQHSLGPAWFCIVMHSFQEKFKSYVTPSWNGAGHANWTASAGTINMHIYG